MGYLEKNFILHERDAKGDILPIDYPLKESGIIGFEDKSIKMIPLVRGDIITMGNSKDFAWEEVISEHLVEPKMTAEELKNTKILRTKEGKLVTIIDLFLTILYEISGVKKTVKQTEDEIKKNLE